MKISPKQYAKLMFETLSGAEKSETVLYLERIAKLIKKNRDQKKFPRIKAEFEKILKEKKGLVEATVFSTEKLASDELEKIKEKIAQKKETEKGKVELKNIVDQKIKGGLIFKIESEVFDASIAHKLGKLSANLQ